MSWSSSHRRRGSERARLHPSVWAAIPLASFALAVGACSADTADLFSNGGGGGAGETTSIGPNTSATGSVAATSGTGVATSGTGTPASSGSGTLCGDGSIDDPSEACDGPDLGGHDCTEQGFSNPNGVGCDGACQLDFSGCMNTCGDGVLEPGEQCDDGNTNPLDACSAQCVTQGTTCATAIPITLPLGPMDLTGTTSGSDTMQSSGCQQATGPELVFSVTPLHAGFLTAWTDPSDTNFDAIVYATSACNGATEIECGDNFPGEPDLISFPVGDGMQPVLVVVDGYDGAMGDFTLHLDLSTGKDCSDPVPILAGGDQSVPVRALGTTSPWANDSQGSCGGQGPDVVYALTRLTPGNVGVSTHSASTLNSVTYARSSCADTISEASCNNPTGTNDSSIALSNVGATPEFVWVDGLLGTMGAYDVTFTSN